MRAIGRPSASRGREAASRIWVRHWPKEIPVSTRNRRARVRGLVAASAANSARVRGSAGLRVRASATCPARASAGRRAPTGITSTGSSRSNMTASARSRRAAAMSSPGFEVGAAAVPSVRASVSGRALIGVPPRCSSRSGSPARAVSGPVRWSNSSHSNGDTRSIVGVVNETGHRSGATKMPRMVAPWVVPVRWRVPPGIHRARVGGSTQYPSPISTAMTPLAAQAIWCCGCSWVSNQ